MNFRHVEIVQLAFRLRNAVLITAWAILLAIKRTEDDEKMHIGVRICRIVGAISADDGDIQFRF